MAGWQDGMQPQEVHHPDNINTKRPSAAASRRTFAREKKSVARLWRNADSEILNAVGLLSMHGLKIGQCGVGLKKKLFWVKVKCCRKTL